MADVLWMGTFDPAFARNRKLTRLLELGGHRVRVVNEPIWGADRPAIVGGRKLGLAVRAARAYAVLAWRLLTARRPDVVLFSHPGWFDMVVLAPLARLRRIPVVFDIFISLWDTVVADRRMVAERSITSKALRTVDRVGMRVATRVIADTPAHADFFAELAGVARGRFDVVWLGAQDDVFGPVDDVAPEDDLVVFHGTFIGLQGLETIVRAAKLLEPHGIRVRLIGSGQEQALVDDLLAELRPDNVEPVGLVPLAEVPRHIASAAVCLGIFGTSGKADRVVPNKVYECLAIGRPVLTGDTSAVSSAFDGEVAVVPVGDPAQLSLAVRELIADPARRDELARTGHQRYESDYEEHALSALFESVLDRAVDGSPPTLRTPRR